MRGRHRIGRRFGLDAGRTGSGPWRALALATVALLAIVLSASSTATRGALAAGGRASCIVTRLASPIWGIRLTAGFLAMLASLVFVPLATADPSPIAAYSFDEGSGTTLSDSIGNHDGTIEGATWTSEGKYGSALEFDGEDDRVTIPDASDLDLTHEFTVEAWVRPDTIHNFAPVIAKAEAQGERQPGYILAAQGWEKPTGFVTNSTTASILGAKPALTADGETWTHLAFTSDGETLKLYRDGELVATKEAVDAGATEANLEIGAAAAWGTHFKGAIDELRIYNEALSEGQIQADRDSEVGLEQRPIAAYSFDEGSGTTLSDSIGNHDGTIEGATWTSEGKYGSALEFDGEDDRVTIPDASDLDLTHEFTVEAWVRPDTIHNFAPVIAKAEAQGERQPGYILAAQGWEKPTGFVTNSTTASILGAKPALTADGETWTHLAFTSDGETLKLYRDGELVATKEAVDAGATEANLEIGAAAAWGTHFKGAIDELRIYNEALSEGQIQADRDSEVGLEQRPIAAYSFDEGSGTTLSDSIGNHDGTIEGATWTSEGKYGSALEFDGEDDRVTIPDASDLDLTHEFTVEAWVRPDSLNYWSSIFGKGENVPGSGISGYDLAANATGGKPRGEIVNANTSASASGPSAVPTGAWTHLAFTFDGTTLRIYVNGQLEGETETEIHPGVTEAVALIGYDPTFETYFHGRIDELRIYDEALDQGGIEASSEQPIQKELSRGRRRAGVDRNPNLSFMTNNLRYGAVDADVAVIDTGIDNRFTKGIDLVGRAGCQHPDWLANPEYTPPSYQDPNWWPDQRLNEYEVDDPFLHPDPETSYEYGCLDGSGSSPGESGGHGTGEAIALGGRTPPDTQEDGRRAFISGAPVSTANWSSGKTGKR